jgi:hypothetical protein
LAGEAEMPRCPPLISPVTAMSADFRANGARLCSAAHKLDGRRRTRDNEPTG